MLLCKGVRYERAEEARHLIPKGQQKGMGRGRVILPEEGPVWNPVVIFVWLALEWCEFMVIEEVLTGRQVARFTLTDLQADIPMWSCLLIRRNAKVSVEGWQEDKQVRPRGMELKQNKGQKPFLAIHLILTPKGKRALLVCLGKN